MGIASTFWLAIMAVVWAAIWLLCSASRAALLAVLVIDLLALAWAGFWTWFFRDGLAPGFIPSSGLEALRRFAAGMIFPSSICGVIGIIAIGFYFWRKRRRNAVVADRFRWQL